MAATVIPARFFEIDIEVGYSWTRINGLTGLTPAPSDVTADTGTYESQGFASHQVMERGLAFTLTGFRLEDVDTGDRDAGQQAVEELADLIGPEANGHFKIRSPGGLTDTFFATVSNVAPFGGDKNAPAAWNATLTVSGPPEHSYS